MRSASLSHFYAQSRRQKTPKVETPLGPRVFKLGSKENNLSQDDCGCLLLLVGAQISFSLGERVPSSASYFLDRGERHDEEFDSVHRHTLIARVICKSLHHSRDMPSRGNFRSIFLFREKGLPNHWQCARSSYIQGLRKSVCLNSDRNFTSNTHQCLPYLLYNHLEVLRKGY